jgi:beta-phosphoglucomutase-like phosphatase (HAD superfamily)
MKYIINNYDLFIFDLDDTLIYTENYHYDAWIETLKNNINNNFSISHDYFFSKFHTINKDGIKNYLSNELNLVDPNKIISEKNNIYIELIKKESQNIKMVDGAKDLLELIISNNKKFVIVSNSLKSNIDFYSELFPILKHSSKNYYREMFQNKKPNPECYLSVVDDFPNERKIGFEDSITGIEALTQVRDITHIFINNSKYIHYDYIINTYKTIIIIKNYFELNNKYIENKLTKYIKNFIS